MPSSCPKRRARFPWRKSSSIGESRSSAVRIRFSCSGDSDSGSSLCSFFKKRQQEKTRRQSGGDDGGSVEDVDDEEFEEVLGTREYLVRNVPGETFP